MERLGYARGMFKRDARSLNPNARDAGGYQALHDDGRRVLSAAYVHIAHETRAAAVVLKTVCLSGLLLTEDLLGTIVLDHKYYLDSGLWSRVVRLRPVGVEGISKRLEREMQASRKPTRRFATLDELRSVLDERNDKWHARLVQRGLYQKVSAEEERRVLAQLGAESDE
jgi:hypothetical protein